jgi:hypothetical protein
MRNTHKMRTKLKILGLLACFFVNGPVAKATVEEAPSTEPTMWEVVMFDESGVAETLTCIAPNNWPPEITWQLTAE